MFRLHLYRKKSNYILDAVNEKRMGKYHKRIRKTVEFPKLNWNHEQKVYSDETTLKLKFMLLQL